MVHKITVSCTSFTLQSTVSVATGHQLLTIQMTTENISVRD